MIREGCITQRRHLAVFTYFLPECDVETTTSESTQTCVEEQRTRALRSL